ncbi:MAG: hypothetical protein ACLPY1_00630 [Terracidiphilus sp.]
MTLTGKADVESRDLGAELQFKVTRERGLIEVLAIPAFLAFFLYVGWKANRYWFVVAGGLWAAVMTANWLQGSETELRVTTTELTATGNLGRMFSTQLRVPAAEVTALGWEGGSEDADPGLYVKRGWRRLCIMPGLNKEQATEVADAIRRRFPEIGPEKYGYPWLGGKKELTTLGLSKGEPDGRQDERR